MTDAFIHGALDALAADVQQIKDNKTLVQREIQAQQRKVFRRSKRVRRPNKKYADGVDEMIGATVGSYRSAIKGDEKLKWECARMKSSSD